jgi:hypothetical protein
MTMKGVSDAGHSRPGGIGARLAVACLIAAVASPLRGGRYVYGESAGLAGPPGEGNAADSASPASRR